MTGTLYATPYSYTAARGLLRPKSCDTCCTTTENGGRSAGSPDQHQCISRENPCGASPQWVVGNRGLCPDTTNSVNCAWN
eukprot:m.128526 g.128526  ORF g.128526 m.128526 type:complete len:80 (+) comp11241_c2_seq3:29-268(+)